MPRIKRSRESRIGGGARCSRRHSPRNSKIVAAESRASSSARLIDVLAMSAAAPRLDVVAADPVIGLDGCERETELPFHRARQKPAHAVLLPVCRLHHLFDACPIRLAQQREHALLLGEPLTACFWLPCLRRCFGSGGLRGLRYNGLRWSFLWVRPTRRGVAPPWRVRFGVPLFGCGTLEILRHFDGTGRLDLGSFGSRRQN